MPTFRLSIFSKNSRTGFKTSVRILEQCSQKLRIFQDVPIQMLSCQWKTVTSCISLTCINSGHSLERGPEWRLHLLWIFVKNINFVFLDFSRTDMFLGRHLPFTYLFLRRPPPPPPEGSCQLWSISSSTIDQSILSSFLQPVVTNWSIMAVRAQVDQTKQRKLNFECWNPRQM